MKMTAKNAAETLVHLMDEREIIDSRIRGLREFLADKTGDGITVADKVVVYNPPSTRSNFDKDKLKTILATESELSKSTIDFMFKRAHSESDVTGFISVVRLEKWRKWKRPGDSVAA